MVFSLAVRARAGAHLLHRLPGCGKPVRAAARRAGAAACAGVGAPGTIPGLAQPLLPVSHGRGLPHRCLVGPRALGSGVDGPDQPRRQRSDGRGVGAPLAALPLVRQRRPDLLRLRLGNATPRDGVPRDLSGRAHHGTECRDLLVIAMAALPAAVRRGAHQVARRSVLAGSDVSRVLLRDAADAESADVGTSTGCPRPSTAAAW